MTPWDITYVAIFAVGSLLVIGTVIFVKYQEHRKKVNIQ